MEKMDLSATLQRYSGRRVLITGHTGFKGSWLTCMLQQAGAKVSGYALPPEESLNLWEEAGLSSTLTHECLSDIRDPESLRNFVRKCQPELIFHLAAQPLVRRSYQAPIETFDVNVMGTLRLLEASQASTALQAIVVITSDKCYAPSLHPAGHRESDPLGGGDPYSASKACQELVTASWRASFHTHALIATARAGNVIGGGDWARDRLLPDLYRAKLAHQSVLIRNPHAVRPWQHVLEPLTGYLQLGVRLMSHEASCAQAWNFGPSPEDAKSVSWVCDRAAKTLGTTWQIDPQTLEQPSENQVLLLDSQKSEQELQWTPNWSVDRAVDETTAWYANHIQGKSARELMLAQFAAYSKASIPHSVHP